jgi:DNA mismatch repair protein MutL
MGEIRLLPANLVNRIAAGECVERPASVLKELVENSLDAGASRIDVAVLDGGRELIQVADDGMGMGVDDLRLSVAAHATSKIRSDEDLFSIHTMGFRGEALASIGAVSRLRIVSRTRDSEVAYALAVEAGAASEPIACAGPSGTCVEVRDLFYCVPARRKFLRTNQTEMGHITEQFARIALAHPGVSFTLKNQNRPSYDLPATSDRRQRIADFYGPELAEVLLPIRRAGDRILVEGYIAPPAQCRRSGKWEYVFVNGRFIRDRFISHAIKAAYRSLIQPDEFPVAFLFITIQPDQVDVNVHPTKIEVRWRDSNYVHGQVLAALREKFLSTNLDRPLRPPVAENDAYRERVREAMVDFFTHAKPKEPHSTPMWNSAPCRAIQPSPGDVHPAVRPEQNDLKAPRSEGDTCTGYAQKTPAENFWASSANLCGELPPCGEADQNTAGLRAMQIHNSYLVVEVEDGVLIIDQHALHERILYEQLRRRTADRPLESQRLLLPDVLRVPADRMEALEVHAELLQRLGLELTPAGPQDVAVHAFPQLLARANVAEFVRDLLDLLCEAGQRPNLEALVHDVLDMMACKAAVKAGDALTAQEISALLAQREVAERRSHCPHGRPTTLHLTLRELEGQFKRR